MFGKQPKDSQPSDLPELPDVRRTNLELSELEDIELMDKPEVVQPEVVTIIEKLSGILSPYFIVIVGLFLYQDNFAIGGVLILIGLLTLFKISRKDITEFVANLRNMLNSGK